MRICTTSVGIGTIAAAVLAGGSTAAVTPASAVSPATITVAKRCYVNRSESKRARMTVTGTGFTPGATVQITSSDGSVKRQTTASAIGTIAYTTPAPDPSYTLPGKRTVTLTATDASTAVTATTPVTVAPFDVGIKPSQAVPTARVTWYFAGFNSGKQVFGHYVHSSKQVALTRFGRASGACGVLRARARLYPGGHPRYGLYGLQFDDSRRYSQRTSPRLDRRIKFYLSSAPSAG